MTSTRLPSGLGSRRAVPRGMNADQRDRLQRLLDDPDTWVHRLSWQAFLTHGGPATLVDTAELTADQRAAALAWLRQQRHALHRELVGEPIAPDGWLEALPIVQRLESLGPMGERGGRVDLPPADHRAAQGPVRPPADQAPSDQAPTNRPASDQAPADQAPSS